MGKRLGEYTKDLPKCMVPVGGSPLIRHMLELLDQMELKRIIIVTGYQKDELTGFIEGLSLRTPVIFISNDIYDRTNNIYSLLLTKDYLEQDDTLLLESDLVYEDAVLTDLVADPRETVAVVDRYADWMSGTCVTVDDEDGRIIRFVMGSEFSESEKDSYYKTVNIYKFGRDFLKDVYVPALEAECASGGLNHYYELVLKTLTDDGTGSVYADRIEGKLWYEIDNEKDLMRAEELFRGNEGQR